MLKLVFSIPIHERLEAVVDQIVNIQSLNSDAGIVLHLSLGYSDANSDLSLSDFEQLLANFENVYINPNRVRTGNYDIIQAHIANFNYIKNIFDFEYFCMCASNELFVKPGLYDYISTYDCGLDYNDVDKNVKWYAGRQAKTDEALKSMMASVQTTKVVGSQIEGTFYRKNLFEKIVKVIIEHYNYQAMDVAYAREEVYFSTIFWALNKADEYRVLKQGMFTFCPWERQFTMNVRLKEVQEIICNGKIHLYSVKRVDRKINDCIRAYVRQLYGYVEKEQVLLNDMAKSFSSAKLHMLEVIKEIHCRYLVFKKVFKKIRSVSDGVRYVKQYLQI